MGEEVVMKPAVLIRKNGIETVYYADIEKLRVLFGIWQENIVQDISCRLQGESVRNRGRLSIVYSARTHNKRKGMSQPACPSLRSEQFTSC